MLRSNSGGKSGLRARFKPIASGSNTLNRSKLLAGAAEPNMHVLIFHTELRRELFHRDTFVTGSTQGREDAGFQGAASAAGRLSSGKLARASCHRQRATPTAASSSPGRRGLRLSARIGPSKGSFNSPEFLDDYVALLRELDKGLKS